MRLEQSSIRRYVSRRDDDRERDIGVVEWECGEIRRHLHAEDALRIEEDKQDAPSLKLRD